MMLSTEYRDGENTHIHRKERERVPWFFLRITNTHFYFLDSRMRRLIPNTTTPTTALLLHCCSADRCDPPLPHDPLSPLDTPSLTPSSSSSPSSSILSGKSSLFRTITTTAVCGAAVASSPAAAALLTAKRFLIVPRQLKAYGDTFSPSSGDRSDHLAGDAVLQKVTNQSKSLLSNVKTSTVESFEEMGLAVEVRRALDALEITTPSPIQQASASPLLQRKDVLLAAPHGEGKTVAFVAPLYSNMLKDRDVYRIPLREHRPRTIIMAPTRELIQQLHHVCKTFDAATGLTSVSLVSNKRVSFHVKRLLKQTLPDVLIMHPRALLKLIRKRRLFLDDLRYIAVDEADTMLSSKQDHDAVKLAIKVQRRMQYKHLWPVSTQFVFSTSFITRKLEHVVAKKFPDMVPVFRKQAMHSPSPTLQHRFYPTIPTQKMDLLVYLLQKHGNQPQAVLTDEQELQAATVFTPLSSAPGRAHWEGVRAPMTKEEIWKRSSMRRAPSGALLRLSGATTTTTGTTLALTTGAGHEAQPLLFQENDSGAGGVISFPDATTTTTSTSSTTDSQPPTQQQQQQQHEPRHQHPTREERLQLEGAKPTRWDHLTTVAAPFSASIPRTIFADGKRIMVFFADIDSCTAIYHQLKARGFSCALLHAALPYRVRQDMFRRFASGACNILLATDVAARGLDVPVDVVINFQMPSNSVAYLSRAGRVGRMGREGRVESLYTKQQGVIVTAIRTYLKSNIPLHQLSNWKQHMMTPRYAEWAQNKISAVARSYVSLISKKTIPAHLERTYLRHNATWRPLYRPQTVYAHGGVAPSQQQKIMDAVKDKAVWFRKGMLAKRKGGTAKFGGRTLGVWNYKSGATQRGTANSGQSSEAYGIPSGPPS